MIQQGSIQYNEVICFLIIIWVMVFIVVKKKQFKSLPNINLVVVSILSEFLGYICTILEGFYLPDFYNHLEHLLHFISAILLVIWIYLIQFKHGGDKNS